MTQGKEKCEKNLTRLENIPFEGGCLKTRQSWNRQVNRPPCHNKANIIFSTWISYFLWYFFNVLDVSYYVNNNESDYISVLAKINGDKVLGALKRVIQGYSDSWVPNKRAPQIRGLPWKICHCINKRASSNKRAPLEDVKFTGMNF